MESKIVLPLVLLLVLPLTGCIEAAALALSALAGGPEAAAMKQTGPMAESVGQQVAQQALGMIDMGSTALCNLGRNQTEARTSVPVAAAPSAETPAPLCTYRDVCLPGFDKPTTMRVCEGVEQGSAEAAVEGPRAWSWEQRLSGNFAAD